MVLGKVPGLYIEKAKERRELATESGNTRFMLKQEIKYPRVPEPLIRELCPNDRVLLYEQKRQRLLVAFTVNDPASEPGVTLSPNKIGG